jgi:methyl-accepting chemotaxis protein
MNFLIQYWSLTLIGGILAAISLGFVFRFILPANRIGRELTQAAGKLQEIKSQNGNHVADLERIAKEAMESDRLAHCWSEFTETLHPQTTVNAMGQDEVSRWRATALAETFFTEQALVETPLKTEFYKHLPGILTGIGIIGTFSGLILGLINFEVSTNADAVRNSLAMLIQNVGHAFIVSASAIALAMLFTWVEKSLVTKRFSEVEGICRLIDSMFDAGAGEEYLARLVEASETSATQATQIKDSLVADLKEVLSELTRQQVEAAAQNNRQLSETLVQTFTDSLKEPMERISSAVERVGGNQGDAVNKLLTDVLSGFTAQMQDMFGGQLNGMTEVLQNTSLAIQTAASKFDDLAANLQDAGKGAADAMADQLEQALAKMEARQEAMDNHMTEFVAQIQSMVKESQSETAQQTQAMLMELGERTASLVSSLQEQGRQASAAHEARQTEMAEHSKETLGQLATQVNDLTDSVRGATEGMRSAVGQLATTTRESLERMNTGAEKLHGASTHLTQGIDGMATVVEKVSGTTDKLNLAANALNGATQASMQVINDYRAARDTFANIVSDLKSTVENAKREASMTSDLVSRMGVAADKLGSARQEAENYLEGVTEVLGETHKAFAENVERTLRQGNAQFHKELAEAVSLLKGAIQDLGDTLDSVVTKG